jgi:hypothetical protein
MRQANRSRRRGKQVGHAGQCVPGDSKGNTMQRVKNDPALASLPPPVSLTPEQLVQLASETGATLGAGGGLPSIIYIGGYLLGQLTGHNA